MAASDRPPLHLLIVDDDEALREALERRFRRRGVHVVAAGSGADALARAVQGRHDVALLDLHLPDMTGIDLLTRLKAQRPELEAIMLTGHGSIETAIQAMQHGAYDYLTKPFHLPELEVYVEKAFDKVLLARRERQWVDQIAFESERYRLIESSPALRRVVTLVEKVAPTDATVLVRGASGTGKELVARALHYNSPRRDRPLVTVNCAALQATLLESELFGHEQGAFTGAVQARSGLIEVAEGGTLFIDEIAEMAPGLQAKLLRVLEDGRYRRVGGTEEARADVRVVAATNRDLEAEQKAGRFREDLFYRLNVVTIALPPLADRREDVPALAEHFLATRQIGPRRVRIDADALEALGRHDWPGNVRELANVLERAQILADGDTITLDALPDNLLPGVAEAVGSHPGHLREAERRHIREALRQHNGNKVRAARALGVSRRALYRLIAKHHLEEANSAPQA